MADAPIEYEGTWDEIAAHAPDLMGRRLRLTVLDTEPVADSSELPRLERRLQALASPHPPEEWSRLPPDLTDRLDDYLYGDAGQ